MDPKTRLINAFLTLKDTSFGTLWWVANTLWMTEKTFVLKKGTRHRSHPGVAISRKVDSKDVIIPMLLGTSNRRPFWMALPLKLDDRKEELTFFGTLRPVPFSFTHFLNGETIQENQPKTRLSESDRTKLEQFLRLRLGFKTTTGDNAL